MPRFTFENKFTFGNVIQIGLLLLAAVGVYYGLVGRVDGTASVVAELKPTVIELQTTAATFNTRLTVVESRAETTDKRITELVEAVNKLVDQMSNDRTNTAEIARDVSYLRAWVESVKREARN